MSMTPEEKVNRDIWNVLQKSKLEYLLSSDKPIEYKLTTVVGAGITPKVTEIKVINKLAHDKVIRIIESQTNWQGSRGYFKLEVLQPKFDEVYEKYQKACDVQSYLTTSQKKLARGKTSKNMPKFGQLETPVENGRQEVDDWLKTKDSWALQKMWQVVSALNSERQLRDNDEFSIPFDKFERARVKNQKDLEAILTSFHKRGFIEVSRKIAQQPPSSNPEKPGGMSIWVMIDEHPEIIRYGDTQIKIISKKFLYLRSKLEYLVKEQAASISPGATKQPAANINQLEDLQKRYDKALEEVVAKQKLTEPEGKQLPLNSEPAVVRLVNQQIEFDNKQARITVGNTPCKLPPFKNEHYLCQVMFKKKAGQPVDWSVAYEKIAGAYETHFGKPPPTREHWRVVYDTMVRINNRIKKELNTQDDLFSWQELTLKRNF